MIELYQSYPYDNRYDYIKTFKNKSEQEKYFNNLNSMVLDDTNYVRDDRESFKVPFDYDYLVEHGYNYIKFNNGYKDVYAFIIQKEYVSEDVTRLIFEVDVIQTYMFDFSIRKSFVERMNCTLSEVSDYDEGLALGEHRIDQVVTSIPKHYDYYAMFNGIKEQQLIFTDGILTDVVDTPLATNKPSTIIDGVQYPLHFMPLQEEYAEPTFMEIGTNTSGSTGSVGGNWENGVMSATAFRFLKGYEGFGRYAYQDSSGYWTIAYGVTLHGEKDIYNKLNSQTPLSEEVGARYSYDLLNKNYGKPIVNACKNLGITKQSQFDALCSLAYNCGYGVITGDNSLTRAIKKNPNDESTIRPIFEKFYTTSGGVTLNGLIARRKQECNMYFGKPVEMRPITIIEHGGVYRGTITENNGNGWLPTGGGENE